MGECFVKGCKKLTEMGTSSSIGNLKVAVCDDHIDETHDLINVFDERVKPLINDLWCNIRSLPVKKKGE